MLTDIFAERYANRQLWDAFTEVESKLLVQCFRIVDEQLMPSYYYDSKENPAAVAKWKSLHDRLSMEFGLQELGQRFYSYQTTGFGGKPYQVSGNYGWNVACKSFVCAAFTGAVAADRFIKERLSFIELAFRDRDEELQVINSKLPTEIVRARLHDKTAPAKAMRLPGSREEGVKAYNAKLNKDFAASVEELNERLRRAVTKLDYHNGFIQVASDALAEEQVERPFWALVAGDPKWKNVDIDMKDALDRRDSNNRDPAFYAARALESTIKIISDEKGWTHGGEKGAGNYIDNLASKKNGNFIKDWEASALRNFFSSVRNPLGHGPGSAEMPELSEQQTDWAIETCMSWVKSLIERM